MKYSRNNKSGLYLPEKEQVQFFAPPFLGIAPSGGGQVFLVNENCEGTGTPANWVDTNSPNWDYTTSPISGSQSLNTTTNSFTAYTSFAGQTTCYAKARVRSISGETTIGAPMMGFRTSGDVDLAGVGFYGASSTLTVRILANGGNTAAATTQSTSTNYYVWVDFTSAGTCTVAVSSANSKPTSDGSGNSWVQMTAAAGTATKLLLYGGASTGSFVWDDIQVSATPIA